MTASAAGFTMQGGVLVGVTNSITAGSAVDVKIYGHVAANAAKHANVTVRCGELEVDADVT